MNVAAFYDIDGTITKTTILDPLIWYRRAHDSLPRFAAFAGALLLRAPYYWWVDRHDRARFNIVFYRRYAGLPAETVRDWHRRTFADNLARSVFPAARERIDDHRRRGHRIVLVTGGLDFVAMPLAELLDADELFAARLVERDGIFTGILDGPAIAGIHKAQLVTAYAEQRAVDLAASFAYGNSLADAAMLECVGQPFAVNPDRALLGLARIRGWRTVEWRHHSSGTSCA